MIRVREGDEESLLTIEEFESRARRGELSPLAYVCIPTLTGDRFVQARELPLFVSLYDPRRVHFRTHFQLGRLPLVTGLFAIIAVALFFVSKDLGGGVVTREALLALGAKARARIVEDGEAWRLLAANFLHRDAVHLGFNLFALLNIGTMLEGVYRRGDYVLLLVLSGLCTMGLSAAMSGPVTVGASGLVFGCLGAAVVFGWRYGELLPLRYRIYFGGVVVGYAAVMFYLGLKSGSTDNWGHAGGLICGLVMGFVLVPRLLRLTAPREPWPVVLRPYAISLALVVIVIGPLSVLLPRVFFRTEPYEVSAFGVVIERPSHWAKVQVPLGLFTFGNGVDAFASLGCARLSGPSRLDEAVARFVDGELESLSRAGHIGKLRVEGVAPDTVGSGPSATAARRVSFSFLASDGPLEADALLFSRGQLECALVLAHRPSAPVSSKERLDEIREGLRLVPTRAEEEAQRIVRARPHSARAWLELALAHQSAGQEALARVAFEEAEQRVEESDPLYAQVHFARARFELDYGGDEDAAVTHARLARAGREDDCDADLLLIEALLARGREEEARAVADDLIRRHPDDQRVGEKARALLAGALERASP